VQRRKANATGRPSERVENPVLDRKLLLRRIEAHPVGADADVVLGEDFAPRRRMGRPLAPPITKNDLEPDSMSSQARPTSEARVVRRPATVIESSRDFPAEGATKRDPMPRPARSNVQHRRGGNVGRVQITDSNVPRTKH
jgi:hypothetical protein